MKDNAHISLEELHKLYGMLKMTYGDQVMSRIQTFELFKSLKKKRQEIWTTKMLCNRWKCWEVERNGSKQQKNECQLDGGISEDVKENCFTS